MTAGRILSMSIINANPDLHLVYSPSYGFATRGGNATSDIIVADERIWYPKILNPDILVALSQTSFTASAKLVKEEGAIIFDPLLVNAESRNIGRSTGMVPIMLSEIAKTLGSNIYISMAAVGSLAYYSKLIKLEALLDIVSNSFRKELVNKNSQAIRRGYELAMENKIRTHN